MPSTRNNMSTPATSRQATNLQRSTPSTNISLLPDEQREAEMRRILAKRQERKDSERDQHVSGPPAVENRSGFEATVRETPPRRGTMAPGDIDERLRIRERKFDHLSSRASSLPTIRPIAAPSDFKATLRSTPSRRSVDYTPPQRGSMSSSTLRSKHSVPRSPERAAHLWNQMVGRVHTDG
jgi:hypothetical protein